MNSQSRPTGQQSVFEFSANRW